MCRAWYIILLLFLGVTAQAQMVIVPREKLDAVNNPALSAQSASLVFETTLISPEPFSEEAGVKIFSYRFENRGRDTVCIKRIVTTCTCATATCADKAILPGQASEIVVRYDPKGHPGRFERKVFVYADEDAPVAVLRLAVEVERGADKSGLYPIGMGNIRVRRNKIELHKGIRAVESCAFINVSGKPLKLECENAFLPECLTFRTEPQVVQPGKEGRILIGYDPSKGGERGNMVVMIKGLGVPPTQASIMVELNDK